MGQSHATQRLEAIKENVDEISKKIKTNKLTTDQRDRSHDILLDYNKELNFILNRSIRRSKIRKVEKDILGALEELATLEANLKNIEPRLKAKSLQALQDIEKDVKSISDNLAAQNFEIEKEMINNYKKRISFIDEVDNEIGERKNKVIGAMESAFLELENEEKLKKAEAKHFDLRENFCEFDGSACYEKRRNELVLLKNEVSQINGINDQMKKRKEYLLFNLENNIIALDYKLKKNEDKIVTDNHSIIDDFIRSYNNLEKSFLGNCPINELQVILWRLSDVRIKIDQKLKVLEHQIESQKVDPDIELVPVKETQKVTVREDYSEAPVVSPRVKNKMKKIQRSVENLQKQIIVSNFGKNSHLYNNFKKKLENYKHELEFLPRGNEETCKFYNCISKYIDDVLGLLEKNVSDGVNMTGDLLIDIMTISTSINELGSKIEVTDNKAEDYRNIETELLEHLYYLKRLEIPPARRNVSQFRDYMLIQVDGHLSNLEKIKKKKCNLEDFERNSE